MKKAIIFDLNGVFIKSPKLSDRFKDDFGISEDVFLPALEEIMNKVRKPSAENLFRLWEPYFEKWGIEFTETEFLNYWFCAEKENVALVGSARNLKEKGYRLFILSNNFAERSDYYIKTFPFLTEIFEKLYFSWQTGYTKPDIRALGKVLKENELQAEECLYFDDSQKNIDVAKSLGLEAHIFNEEANRLIKELAKK